MSVTLFRARILSAVTSQKINDFADGMLVVENGNVTFCGPFQADKFPHAKMIDLRGKVIVPGFVDTHSHIPQLDCRGKYGATLLDWLERYIFPAEHAFSDLDQVDKIATRFFKKLILNGTTSSLLYSTIHEAATNRCFEIAAASGLRSTIGKVMMDQYSPDALLEKTSDSLKASEKLCSKWHGTNHGRLHYAFTPRFAPTCTKTLWTETAKLVKSSGAYLQTHIAETHGENARVKELFPEYADYFSLFEETQCACKHAVFAHAIHLSDSEYARMQKSQSKIAHCPTSNFFLKSGAMSIPRVEKAGVAYGLGTDVGAGLSMSLFAEMRHADFTQSEVAVAPRKAFYLATLGGAQVLSMEDKIGSFEAGKYADFVVIETTAVDPSYHEKNLDTDALLSLLVYRGRGEAIEATYVAGEKLNVDFLP